jgi:Uncharacterized conserved protein (COG2071)
MLHLLKRHPFATKAHFDFSLVLTYALPREILTPLLPPEMTLDTYEDFGFIAIAMVQTKHLRPSLLPAWLGQDFFLTGYRIFTRYQNHAGRNLRGLKILRSDTDKTSMTMLGNLMTHYNYRKAEVQVTNLAPERFELNITTPNAEADLHVVADVSAAAAKLPASSPFPDLRAALRFAGPLPHTFSYEPQTNSVIIIKGVRSEWHPRLVTVEVKKTTFFAQPNFRGVTPILASAFYVTNIPYRWERGIVEPIKTS